MNRFTSAADDSNDDLVTQFKDAFANENIDEFGECVQRVADARANKTPVDAPLLALIDQLDILLVFHGDLIKKWVEEDPRIADALKEFVDWGDSFFGDDQGVSQ